MSNIKRSYEDIGSEEIHRRTRELDFVSGTTLRSPPPEYDPIITPIVTGWALNVGFGVTASALIGSAATALATTSVILGIQVRS